MDFKKSGLKWKVSDILGFTVFDQKGTKIGVLFDVVLTGSSDILVVKCCNEKVLIPVLKNVIKEINIARKKIFVVLPKEYEGIYDKVRSADGALEYNGYFVYED
jgi:16S rRNA processing protein RimM